MHTFNMDKFTVYEEYLCLPSFTESEPQKSFHFTIICSLLISKTFAIYSQIVKKFFFELTQIQTIFACDRKNEWGSKNDEQAAFSLRNT